MGDRGKCGCPLPGAHRGGAGWGRRFYCRWPPAHGRSLVCDSGHEGPRTQQESPRASASPEPPWPAGVWPVGHAKPGRTRSSHSASERLPALECARQTGREAGPGGELGRGAGQRARCAPAEAPGPPTSSLRSWWGQTDRQTDQPTDPASGEGRGAGGAERLAARGALLPSGPCFPQNPVSQDAAGTKLLNERINT